FSAAAVVLAGFLFLSPFPLPEPTVTAPVLDEVVEEPTDWMAPLPIGPPTASPIAGLDMHKNLTSGFGMRMHPVLKKQQLHRGIDLKARAGTPVQATADGVVIFAGTDGLYGIVVRIQHAGGYVTVYSHLSRHQVKVGQEVVLGQMIAAVGSTGASTAPHLHYEVRKNDKPIDPLALLD
ncbi:MAG: M23 family metallopeptidase, partial [Bacteroidota bacterium]